MSEEQADQTIRAVHARDRAAHSAGVQLLAVSAGRATVQMTVREDMVNGHGTCHGGYLFLLADIAFSYACNTEGVLTVAAGADVTFAAPVDLGARVQAAAEHRVSFGRDGRQGLYDVTVTDTSTEALVAVFTGRSHRIGDKPS